jgi:hypothetical protein
LADNVSVVAVEFGRRTTALFTPLFAWPKKLTHTSPVTPVEKVLLELEAASFDLALFANVGLGFV